jgi:hypothetical protein
MAQQTSWHIDLVWGEFCDAIVQPGVELAPAMAIHCLHALRLLSAPSAAPLAGRSLRLTEAQSHAFMQHTVPVFLARTLSSVANEIRAQLLAIVQSQDALRGALADFCRSLAAEVGSPSASAGAGAGASVHRSAPFALVSDWSAACALLAAAVDELRDDALNAVVFAHTLDALRNGSGAHVAARADGGAVGAGSGSSSDEDATRHLRALRRDAATLLLPRFVGSGGSSGGSGSGGSVQSARVTDQLDSAAATHGSNLARMFAVVLRPLQAQLHTLVTEAVLCSYDAIAAAALPTSEYAIAAAAADATSLALSSKSSPSVIYATARAFVARTDLADMYALMCQHYHLLVGAPAHDLAGLDRDEDGDCRHQKAGLRSLDSFVMDLARIGLPHADPLISKQALYLLRTRARHRFAADAVAAEMATVRGGGSTGGSKAGAKKFGGGKKAAIAAAASAAATAIAGADTIAAILTPATGLYDKCDSRGTDGAKEVRCEHLSCFARDFKITIGNRSIVNLFMTFVDVFLDIANL